MSDQPIGYKKRLRQLCDDGEYLVSQGRTSETDEGHYYLVTRFWKHPTVDDAHILSERYAYLTKGDGSDGWVDNGINRQVPPGQDPQKFAQELAKGYAATSARLGRDDEPAPHTFDLVHGEDR